MELIGRRIRNLRTEHNMTQRELAKRLGLVSSAISNYEKGTREISIEIIIKISDLFEVDTSYLLGVNNVMQSGKRKLQVSDDEIEFILEMRKQSSYKYMIYNPKNYARLIEMRTSDYVVKM